MAGKGSSPRNCFSKDFKSNYDDILWSEPKVMNSPTKRDSLWKITYKQSDAVKALYFYCKTEETAISLFKKHYPTEAPNFINAELYIE